MAVKEVAFIRPDVRVRQIFSEPAVPISLSTLVSCNVAPAKQVKTNFLAGVYDGTPRSYNIFPGEPNRILIKDSLHVFLRDQVSLATVEVPLEGGVASSDTTQLRDAAFDPAAIQFVNGVGIVAPAAPTLALPVDMSLASSYAVDPVFPIPPDSVGLYNRKVYFRNSLTGNVSQPIDNSTISLSGAVLSFAALISHPVLTAFLASEGLAANTPVDILVSFDLYASDADTAVEYHFDPNFGSRTNGYAVVIDEDGAITLADGSVVIPANTAPFDVLITADAIRTDLNNQLLSMSNASDVTALFGSVDSENPLGFHMSNTVSAAPDITHFGYTVIPHDPSTGDILEDLERTNITFAKTAVLTTTANDYVITANLPAGALAKSQYDLIFYDEDTYDAAVPATAAHILSNINVSTYPTFPVITIPVGDPVRAALDADLLTAGISAQNPLSVDIVYHDIRVLVDDNDYQIAFDDVLSQNVNTIVPSYFKEQVSVTSSNPNIASPITSNGAGPIPPGIKLMSMEFMRAINLKLLTHVNKASFEKGVIRRQNKGKFRIGLAPNPVMIDFSSAPFTAQAKNFYAQSSREYADAFQERRFVTIPGEVSVFENGINTFHDASLAASVIAGVRASKNPSQSLTNFDLPQLTGIRGTWDILSDDDLDVMADGGNFVLIQDSTTGPLFALKQQSTDTTDINKVEISVTDQLDVASLSYIAALRPFVGSSNVTDSFIMFIRSTIDAVSETLRGNKIVKSAVIKKAIQDPINIDSINVCISIAPLIPANNFDLDIII